MSNEKGDELLNACFWLSLAASQLSGQALLAVWDSLNDSLSLEDRDLLLGIDAELIESTALALKRLVEASVLSFHPEWQDRVGESVQAFSDFLVYCLEGESVVSEWAVVVVDSCSGFVDIYKVHISIICNAFYLLKYLITSFLRGVTSMKKRKVPAEEIPSQSDLSRGITSHYCRRVRDRRFKIS